MADAIPVDINPNTYIITKALNPSKIQYNLLDFPLRRAQV